MEATIARCLTELRQGAGLSAMLQAAIAAEWNLATTALRDRVATVPAADFLQQSQRLQLAWDKLQTICPALLTGDPAFWQTLWRLWLPLAQILERRLQQQSEPLILGVLGAQGCGKTTLGKVLTGLLEQQGYRVCCLSLDDGYLSYRDRCQLQQQDPRLIWRGPPGTHDLEKLVQTLADLKAGRPTLLPRFDKSLQAGAGDRLADQPIDRVDLVIFEGWFVGCQPLTAWPPKAWPWPIVTAGDRQFATDCHDRLRAYEPLWTGLDQLLILRPQDFCWSFQWRLQAEQELQRQRGQSLPEAAIAEFVQYFWKALHPQLFIEPLCSAATDSKKWVAAIGANHAVTHVDC